MIYVLGVLAALEAAYIVKLMRERHEGDCYMAKEEFNKMHKLKEK